MLSAFLNSTTDYNRSNSRTSGSIRNHEPSPSHRLCNSLNVLDTIQELIATRKATISVATKLFNMLYVEICMCIHNKGHYPLLDCNLNNTRALNEISISFSLRLVDYMLGICVQSGSIKYCIDFC